MIGAADIVADRLGRMRADEDRAGVVDRSAQGVGVARDDFEMLGREPIDERRGRGQVRREDDRAVVAPARAGDLRARQVGELGLDRRAHRPRQRGVVGDEDRLRRFVVLGLGEKVGGDKTGIGAGIGEHDDFRRTGDHVDADDAEHAPLGRRDIGVAGADDLGDRLDALRSVGERGDRLRAADAIDFRYARDFRRRRAPAD